MSAVWNKRQELFDQNTKLCKLSNKSRKIKENKINCLLIIVIMSLIIAMVFQISNEALFHSTG